VEAIIVAAISAVGAIAVALINARVTRQREASPRPAAGGLGSDIATRPGPFLRAWTRLWEFFGRLPPLGRPRAAWVAALVGFLFGGFGIALYFRRQADVLVGLVFLIPLFLATRGDGAETTFGWWYWPFATLAATYCVLRVESANRRLDAED
jgi:hypothetical protein